MVRILSTRTTRSTRTILRECQNSLNAHNAINAHNFVNAHHAINAHNIGRMSEFCERAQRDQCAEFCQRASRALLYSKLASTGTTWTEWNLDVPNRRTPADLQRKNQNQPCPQYTRHCFPTSLHGSNTRNRPTLHEQKTGHQHDQ